MALPQRAGGFLIDLDGTIIEGGQLIPGSAEALKALTRQEIPYRVVTNTTSKPCSAILTNMSALGIDLQPEQLITAPIIGRDYLLVCRTKPRWWSAMIWRRMSEAEKPPAAMESWFAPESFGLTRSRNRRSVRMQSWTH